MSPRPANLKLNPAVPRLKDPEIRQLIAQYNSDLLDKSSEYQPATIDTPRVNKHAEKCESIQRQAKAFEASTAAQ